MVRTVSRWGFLLSLALLFACVEPGNDDDSADDDDSSDDDDAADDDDGIPLGPSGTVVGTLFDIETDEPIQATVHEHASDPINAVESTPVGYFELYPQSFADGQTTEFFAYSPSGDYVDLFVALTRDAYLRAGHGLELFMEPSLGWHETHVTL